MNTHAGRQLQCVLRLLAGGALVALMLGSFPYGPDAASTQGQESRGVSPDALLSAIEAGVREDVQPYRLKPVLKSGTIDGAVYTPHVRVARFARDAYLQGLRVTPENIPAAVREPVLHVAMLWKRGDPVFSVENLSDVVVAAIVRPPSRSLEPDAAFHPGWLVPALRMENVNGASLTLGELPFDNSVKVGAFPMEFAERAVLEFAAYRTYWTQTGGNSRDLAVGFVRGPLK